MTVSIRLMLLIDPFDQRYILGEDYTWRYNFDTAVYSPCGGSTVLNINSDLRVSNTANKQGIGYIATDSVNALLSFWFVSKY